MNNTEGAFVIGWDFSKGEGHDRDSLIVMQGDRNSKMKIVSAFYDDEAHDIYSRLTRKKVETDE